MPEPKDPKGTKEFHATRRLQGAYEAGVQKVLRRVLMPRKKGQTLEEWLAELTAKSQSEEVTSAAEFLAGRMVREINVRNARTWREAASRSQHSRKLYALMQKELEGPVGHRLRQLRRENAKYITSIVPEAARRLADEITAAETRGARPGTIDKMMRTRFPQLLRSRVKLIARTESQKVSAALTQARAEQVGSEWYEWLSSRDQRTRKSHKKMDGVLVPYADPPSPEAVVGEKSTLGTYHAGECPNCRCSQAPMLDADDLTWPRRVYWRGSVRSMNKQQFLKIAGTRQGAAA